MNRLTKLATAALVAGSVLISGCYSHIHVHKKRDRGVVRARVIDRPLHRHDSPLFVVCYEFPSHRHHCYQHRSCLGVHLNIGSSLHSHRGEGRTYWHRHETKSPRRGSLKPDRLGYRYEFRQQSAFPEGRTPEFREKQRQKRREAIQQKYETRDQEPDKRKEKRERFPVKKEKKSRFKSGGP